MTLLNAIKAFMPPVRLRPIRNLTTDLRDPWQVGLAAHRRRRARECRKVCTTYMPQLVGMLRRQAD
jgi:hypothetical protein